jgi:spore photoproduct lyase
MKVSDKVEFLPTNSLRPDPNQPRKTFDEETITNMAKTMKRTGIINAIEVDEKDCIVTGEIRWKAAKKVGIQKVPVIRISEITPDERLERQLIENLHHHELDSVERENAIYKLWKTGRYESHRELGDILGYHHATIDALIEAKEFRDRAGGLPANTPTSLISETQGLDDQTRVKILEKTTRGEIRRPAPQTEIRRAVKIVKDAPEPIKNKFLKGELSLEKAVEITEITHEAPEPIKHAIAEEKITTEQAREATEIYKRLRERGTEISEEKIENQIEEMSKERRFLERRKKTTIGKMRKVLSGEEIEKPQITWSRLFCGTINNLSGAREGNITHNRIRFFAKTPKEIVCPHFWEFIWATGCSFRPACAWCYLQGTFRGDITPRFFEKEELEKQLETWFNDVETLSYHLADKTSGPQILVTGELADSLMGEQYWKEKYGMPFSHWIIQSFEKQKKHKVLFLTKSSKVENLLAISPHKQAIVSFSMNAETVAKQWEKGAFAVSSIKNRIEMAGKLQDAGYEVRIRIDPMVPILEWEKHYKELVDNIFSRFTPERITIGSLRGLESTIRFCVDRTWVSFLSKDTTGWGRKIPDEQRKTMYSTLIGYLKNRYGFSKIGLCKETHEMWRKIEVDAGTSPYWSECKCNCVS